MLPFRIALRPGEPPYRQVVYAATRAVVSGELPAGAAFPSIRELSQSLKINPNTAQKIVTELIRTGILEVIPGIGTFVRSTRPASTRERKQLLSRQVEQLVVEAKRLGVDAEDLMQAVRESWAGLEGMQDKVGEDS